MYGGRREYYEGRPNHGLRRTRYPFDLGFIRGKGFAKILPDIPGRRIGQYPNKPLLRNPDLRLKYPEEGEEDLKPIDDSYGHPCGGGCSVGEYLCVRSCTCIQEKYR